MSDWETGKPPNEELVEVEVNGSSIEAMAIYGRDGVLPHWETQHGKWPADKFRRWRRIEKQSDPTEPGRYRSNHFYLPAVVFPVAMGKIQPHDVSARCK